jgi:hypothetical protein
MEFENMKPQYIFSTNNISNYYQNLRFEVVDDSRISSSHKETSKLINDTSANTLPVRQHIMYRMCFID